jgi:phospholipase C
MGLNPPPTVWQRMADRCWPVKYYFGSSIPWYSVTFPSNSFSGDDAIVPEPLDRFYTDAERGDLASFTIIDPDFWVSDGHPPHDLGLAEAFLGSIYRAMVAGPQWSRSLLVVAFDEHGGFYDHVVPPLVPDPYSDFQRIGFRVPALVIGPTVRTGAVVSTPFDHVSILSTLATRFGIASLGPRMDAAADLSVCLDPERALVASESPRLPPTVELKAGLIKRAPSLGTSQPELETLAAAGGVPVDHVDPRSHDERVQAWLRRAQELEAVKVIG